VTTSYYEGSVRTISDKTKLNISGYAKFPSYISVETGGDMN